MHNLSCLNGPGIRQDDSFAGCWRVTSLPAISVAVTGDACRFAANSKSSQPNTSRQKSFCLILSNPSVRSRETTRPVWLERKTTFGSKKSLHCYVLLTIIISFLIIQIIRNTNN